MPANLEFKQKLLQFCLSMKQESESNILVAMDEAQQSANDYGAPRDRYDSFRAQLMRKRDMLAQQLAVVQEELRHIRQVKSNSLQTEIGPGTLVVLDKQTLFILVGIGKITVDDQVVYVVSPVVPLVAAMKNLKKGNSFTFNGNTFTIQEIC